MGILQNMPARARAEWPSFHGSAVPERHDPFEVGQDFVRALHHRLCQPLTALSCSLEVLQMGREADSRLMEQLQTAITQSGRAMEMLSIFRQMFEAEAPLSAKESSSLPQILEEVITDIALLAEMHAIKFEVRCHGPAARVALSPKLLRQVLWNVLQNCIETTVRGRILIEVVQAHVSITDTAAVSQGEVTTLFDPFSYCENRKQGTRVSNLPLALAQRIIRASDGRIEVRLVDDMTAGALRHERQSKGRCFALQFPAS